MATLQRDSSGNWTVSQPDPNHRVFFVGISTLIVCTVSLICLFTSAFATNAPPINLVSSPLRFFKQPQSVQRRVQPQYGQIKLGAFAAEAANIAGLTYISTTGLANPKDYAKYRASIRSTYGVDLEDMNYFSLAPNKLEHRLNQLEKWILLAGEYGDVTLALEPLGKSKYAVFRDQKVMSRLKNIFETADKSGITLWIRFASESNLRGSKYTAIYEPDEFYKAAKNFKSQMPKNVKLVFSPLINTYVVGSTTQKSLARNMLYGPNQKNIIWDRIGGTIYRTDRSLVPMYNQYYQDMIELAPTTPFQICEVGGPYSQREEVQYFLKLCSQGNFPNLVKVNLFARNINQRADPEAEFGYIDPIERTTKTAIATQTKKPQVCESFIKSILEKSG